jgi:hypothetical protein
MFQLKRILKDISYCQLNEDFLYYKDSNGVLFCENLFTSNVKWSLSKYRDLAQKGSYSFVGDYLCLPLAGCTIIIDIDSGKEVANINRELDFKKDTVNDLKILYYFQNEKKRGLYDFVINKSLWEIDAMNIPSLNYFSNEKYIIVTRKSIISCISVDVGTLLWQLDLSEENQFLYEDYTSVLQKGRIKKCISIYDNKIYLSVNNDLVVVLDALSGEIQNVLKELPRNSNWTNGRLNLTTLPYPPNGVVLSQKNKIGTLVQQTYWELNLKNNEIQFWNLETEFNKDDLIVSNTILEWSSHLLFSSAEKDKLAIFNTNTRQIDWVYDFATQDERIKINNSFVNSKNWIIVSDNQKNLYVFEKKMT